MDRESWPYDERREQILGVAAQVFAAKGLYQASVNDIVRQAGLSKGGMYWYFKSKDELIQGVLRRTFDHDMSDLEAILLRQEPTPARLILFCQQAGNQMERLNGAYVTMLEFYATAVRQSMVQTHLHVYFRKYCALLETLLEQGIYAGELREMNTAVVAIALTGQLEGLTLLWTVDPSAFNLSQQIEATICLFLQGLIQPAP